MHASFKALIATNDNALAAVENSALRRLHFEVATAHDDEELAETLGSERPDLLILDSALPRSGGLETCRRLREDPGTAEIPIIMVTTPGDGWESIEALETGADDCVSRPLQVDALAAHIKAVTRRALANMPRNRRVAGPIEMDLDRWIVTVDGGAVDLTKTEFRLLQALLEAKGRALTRDYLLQHVWSHNTVHGLDTRTVDVHVGRLRRKLGESGRYILTVRNVGFRFEILPEWITRRAIS